jgi:pSer/pThr/pTyr-binding forkhead associated (FHA) protein
MQICPECGAENRAGLFRCEGCGAQLTGKMSPQRANQAYQTDRKGLVKKLVRFLSSKQTQPIKPIDKNSIGSVVTAPLQPEKVEPEPEPEPITAVDMLAPGGRLVLDISGMDTVTVNPDVDVFLGRFEDEKAPPFSNSQMVDLTYYGAYRAGVSRLHAEIRRMGYYIHLIDLGSSNGTFIGNQRLMPYSEYRLQDNDVIRLGEIWLRVYFDDRNVPQNWNA